MGRELTTTRLSAGGTSAVQFLNRRVGCRYHAATYHSFTSAFKEYECHRLIYEPLWVKYGVDVVMSGRWILCAENDKSMAAARLFPSV